MTTIKTKCPTCGEVDMGPTGIWLNLPVGEVQGSYAFTCPECRFEVSKPASRKTVALLVAAGVATTPMPRVAELDLPPEDRSPDPDAPAFTLDDLIGFHFLLRDDAAIGASLVKR